MPVAFCRHFGQISHLFNLTLDFGAVIRPANGVEV
jgi:hypothetical protein